MEATLAAGGRQVNGVGPSYSSSPNLGRIEVGEASDDCLAPKRGFPHPTLPHMGEGLLRYIFSRSPFGS
jgi:hypothetical protein